MNATKERIRAFIRDTFTEELRKTCNMKSRVCRGGSRDLYKLLISTPATKDHMKTDPEHLQIVSGMGHTYIRYKDTASEPYRFIYIDPTIAQFNSTFEGIFVGSIEDLSAIAGKQKEMKGYKLDIGDYLGANYKTKRLPPLEIDRGVMNEVRREVGIAGGRRKHTKKNLKRFRRTLRSKSP